MKKLIFSLTCFMLSIATWAVENYPYRSDYLWLTVPDHADWLYKTGEQATVEVQFYKYGIPRDGIVEYGIGTDLMEDDTKGKAELKNGRCTIKMGHRQPRPLLHEACLSGAGALHRPAHIAARMGRAQRHHAGWQSRRRIGYHHSSPRRACQFLRGQPSCPFRYVCWRRERSHTWLSAFLQGRGLPHRGASADATLLRRGVLRPLRQGQDLPDVGIQRQHLSTHHQLCCLEPIAV